MQVIVFEDGGAEGIRTPDPHNAIVVLYQLSYDPIQKAAKTYWRAVSLSKQIVLQEDVSQAGLPGNAKNRPKLF